MRPEEAQAVIEKLQIYINRGWDVIVVCFENNDRQQVANQIMNLLRGVVRQTEKTKFQVLSKTHTITLACWYEQSGGFSDKTGIIFSPQLSSIYRKCRSWMDTMAANETNFRPEEMKEKVTDGNNT